MDLIVTLEASKIKSGEIKLKVADAEKTEVEIDHIRSKYIPVAVRTRVLFFCTTDLVSYVRLTIKVENKYSMYVRLCKNDVSFILG